LTDCTFPYYFSCCPSFPNEGAAEAVASFNINCAAKLHENFDISKRVIMKKGGLQRKNTAFFLKKTATHRFGV
jgi:hypothetical protein